MGTRTPVGKHDRRIEQRREALLHSVESWQPRRLRTVFNLQGSEIIVLLLIALVVVGPEKLPDAVRRFTRTYNELKKMGSGFQSELKSALDEPMKEMKETASLLQDAANPDQFVVGNQPDVAKMESAPLESPEPDEVADVAEVNEDDSSPEAPTTADAAPFSSIAAANSSASIASRIQATTNDTAANGEADDATANDDTADVVDVSADIGADAGGVSDEAARA